MVSVRRAETHRDGEEPDASRQIGDAEQLVASEEHTQLQIEPNLAFDTAGIERVEGGAVGVRCLVMAAPRARDVATRAEVRVAEPFMSGA